MAVIAEADRGDAYRVDGHASVVAWCRATGRWSHAEATRRHQVARLAAVDDRVAGAVAAGSVGVAQAHELGRAHANPRCGDQLGEVVPVLLEQAERLSHREFRAVVDRWIMLTDLDGAHRDADWCHDRREASIIDVGGGVEVRASGGAVAGVVLGEVFTRFCDAEFHADWEATVDKHGDLACPALLPRTDRQRRFDALVAIFQRAATQAPDTVSPEPLVNVVVDLHTLQRLLDRRRRAPPIPGRTGGPAKPATAPSSPPPTCWGRCGGGGSAASSSTPPVSSSTPGADGACSPAPPATPCCCNRDDVSGPDVTVHPGAAKPTTSPPGTTTGSPTSPTEPRCADGTTGGRPAATPPGATPTATGTPNDPTAPRSDGWLARRRTGRRGACPIRPCLRRSCPSRTRRTQSCHRTRTCRSRRSRSRCHRSDNRLSRTVRGRDRGVRDPGPPTRPRRRPHGRPSVPSPGRGARGCRSRCGRPCPRSRGDRRATGRRRRTRHGASGRAADDDALAATYARLAGALQVPDVAGGREAPEPVDE